MEDNQNNIASLRNANLKEKTQRKLEEYKNRKKAKLDQEQLERQQINDFLEQKKQRVLNQMEAKDSSLSSLKGKTFNSFDNQIQSHEKKNGSGIKTLPSNYMTPDHFLTSSSDFLQSEDVDEKIQTSSARSDVFYFPSTTKSQKSWSSSSKTKKSQQFVKNDSIDYSNHDEDFDISDNDGILLQHIDPSVEMSDSIKNFVTDTGIEEEEKGASVIFEKLNDFGNYLMNLSNTDEKISKEPANNTPIQKNDDENEELFQISPLLIENYKKILRSNSEIKEKNTFLKERIESLEIKVKEKENTLRDSQIEQIQKNSHFESELKLKEDIINQLRKIITFKDEQIEDLAQKLSTFDHKIAERNKKDQEFVKEIDNLHGKINELKEKNQEIPKFALEKKISDSKMTEQLKETQNEKEKNESLAKTIKDLEAKLVSKDEELASDKDVIRNLIYETNKQKSKNYETNMKIFLQKIKDEEEIQEFFQGKEQELKKKLEKEVTKKFETDMRKREEDLKVRYEIQIAKKDEELKDLQEKCQGLSLLAHSPTFSNMNSSISPTKFKK